MRCELACYRNSGRDHRLLSGLTNTLENGVPANILGGIGSDIAYAGGDTFLAVPDRGPNALPFDSAGRRKYSLLHQSVSDAFAAEPYGEPGRRPLSLYSYAYPDEDDPAPTALTPLTYGSGVGLGVGPGAPAQNTPDSKFCFTGRSDNFLRLGSSSVTTNARFDPESVRVSNDGKSVFISDFNMGRMCARPVRSCDRAIDQELHSAVESFCRTAVPSGRCRNEHQHERAHR